MSRMRQTAPSRPADTGVSSIRPRREAGFSGARHWKLRSEDHAPRLLLELHQQLLQGIGIPRQTLQEMIEPRQGVEHQGVLDPARSQPGRTRALANLVQRAHMRAGVRYEGAKVIQ